MKEKKDLISSGDALALDAAAGITPPDSAADTKMAAETSGISETIVPTDALTPEIAALFPEENDQTRRAYTRKLYAGLDPKYTALREGTLEHVGSQPVRAYGFGIGRFTANRRSYEERVGAETTKHNDARSESMAQKQNERARIKAYDARVAQEIKTEAEADYRKRLNCVVKHYQIAKVIAGLFAVVSFALSIAFIVLLQLGYLVFDGTAVYASVAYALDVLVLMLIIPVGCGIYIHKSPSGFSSSYGDFSSIAICKKSRNAMRAVAAVTLVAIMGVSAVMVTFDAMIRPDLFDYRFVDGGVEITGTASKFSANWDEDADQLVIPADIRGKKVVGIGRSFYANSALYNRKITTVQLPAGLEYIAEKAFENTDIETIKFPDSLQSIGAFAFFNVPLKKVDFPEGLTTIGDAAFRDTLLEGTVHLPSSLQTLGAQAFRYTYVSEITMPEGLQNVGSDIFCDLRARNVTIYCEGTKESTAAWAYDWNRNNHPVFYGYKTSGDGNYTFSKYNEGYALQSYGGHGGKAVIPSECDGKPVLAVAAGAFQVFSADFVEELIIPDTVKVIEEGALAGLTNLRKLTVPFVGKSVAAVGREGLFGFVFGAGNRIQRYSDYSQASFAIPDSLEEVVVTKADMLSYGAFSGTSYLERVRLPEALENIGPYAFYESGLKAIELPQSLSVLGTYAFGYARSLESIEIPAALTTISAYAFDSSGLTRVVFPQTLTKIDEDAFARTGLTTVEVPESVTEFGKGVFRQCQSLTALTVPFVGGYRGVSGGSSSVSYLFGSTSSDGSALPDSLQSVTVTDQLRLTSNAFRWCTKLKKVTISDVCTQIDRGAFEGCAGLEEMELPFVGLETGPYDGTADGVFGAIFGTNSNYSMTKIRQTYADSGSAASFYVSPKLKKITIRGNNGGNLPYGAFSGVTMVEEIDLPEIDKLSASVFDGCTALKNVGLAASVTEIPARAFRGCTGLTTYELPQNVTAVGEEAFSGSGLRELIVPNSALTIGPNIIAECGALKRLFIPFIGADRQNAADIHYLIPVNTYTELEEIYVTDPAAIAARTFAGLNTLKRVYIGESCTFIGAGAWADCAKLEDLRLPFVGESAAAGGRSALFGYSFGETDSVSSSYLSAVAQSWQEGDQVKTQTYYLPKSLRKVTVTGETIPFGAFSGCTMLKEIEIPNAQYVGARAFERATGVRYVALPQSVTYVGSTAFGSCPDLAVNIGNLNTDTWADDWRASASLAAGGVEQGKYVYYVNDDGAVLTHYTGEDTELVLPSQLDGYPLTEIRSGAFAQAAALTKLTIPDIVREIGKGALAGCTGLKELTLPFVGARRPVPMPNGTVNPTAGAADLLFGYIFDMLPGAGVFSAVQDWNDTVGQGAHIVLYGVPASLHKVTVTDSIGLSAGAFSGCDRIRHVVCAGEEGTIALGRQALSARALERVDLPAVVLSIGDNCFGRANSAAGLDIYLRAEVCPTVPVNALIESSNYRIFVPQRALETYRRNNDWYSYRDHIFGFSYPV